MEASASVHVERAIDAWIGWHHDETVLAGHLAGSAHPAVAANSLTG